MSYASIYKCTEDEELQDRVVAAACKEAWAGGVEFKGSAYGERLRTYPQEAIGTFMYAIAIDNESDYAYAMDTEGGPNPGSEAVISDAKLQAGVQAHWPLDLAQPLPGDMVPPTPGVPV